MAVWFAKECASYECAIFCNLACTVFFKNVHIIDTHCDLTFSTSYTTAYVIYTFFFKIILLWTKIRCECVKVKEC